MAGPRFLSRPSRGRGGLHNSGTGRPFREQRAEGRPPHTSRLHTRNSDRGRKPLSASRPHPANTSQGGRPLNTCPRRARLQYEAQEGTDTGSRPARQRGVRPSGDEDAYMSGADCSRPPRSEQLPRSERPLHSIDSRTPRSRDPRPPKLSQTFRPPPTPSRTTQTTQTPYNPDDELNDDSDRESDFTLVPFPTPTPPPFTEPPPTKPRRDPTLLELAQDHAGKHPTLQHRHPDDSPPRWYICTFCANTARPEHEGRHVISNPWLFDDLRSESELLPKADNRSDAARETKGAADVGADRGAAELKLWGDDIWGVGPAMLPVRCKVVDGTGEFYTCAALMLDDALYVPSHGKEMDSTHGVNTLCLRALERQGVAGYVRTFGGCSYVDLWWSEDGVQSAATMWAVERTIRVEGWGSDSIWEVVVCRRGEKDKKHVCGAVRRPVPPRVEEEHQTGTWMRRRGNWRYGERNAYENGFESACVPKPKNKHGKNVCWGDQHNGWRGGYRPRNRRQKQEYAWI